VRVAVKYTPTSRRPKGRTNNHWKDEVRQDLEITVWEKKKQDPDYWRSVTMAAKYIVVITDMF
jgi:hypothetical protein